MCISADGELGTQSEMPQPSGVNQELQLHDAAGAEGTGTMLFCLISLGIELHVS